MNSAKIGVALVGGYLLGRTKKAKMAIGLGMFLAGKKLDFDPRRIGQLIADSPALGAINTQVREEVLQAAKSAATGALTKRVNGFADSLQDRTRVLGAGSGDDGADEPQDAEEADSARGTKGSTAERRAPAGSGKARKTASSGARKTASSGARKTKAAAGRTTQGTRKTAARSSRGGSDA